MQHPSLYTQINDHPQFPEQEHLKCPRCDSVNTKFCYYNNYNLSQPRHFCKTCKRYWTKGGSLRNIPIGGASRKSTKRMSSSSAAASSTKRPAPASNTDELAPASSNCKIDVNCTNDETLALIGDNFEGQLMEMRGSFSSVSGSNEGQFSNFVDAMESNKTSEHFGDSDPGSDNGCWTGRNNGWTGLSIYTPGSNFH